MGGSGCDLFDCRLLWGRESYHPVRPHSPPPMKGKHMNKFKVTIIPVDKNPYDVIVEGTDGPEFQGDNGMYKHLSCEMIEITGARYNDKNYDLYIDEEGRLSDQEYNALATKYFQEWLDQEQRMSMDPTIIGTAALVDREPINE